MIKNKINGENAKQSPPCSPIPESGIHIVEKKNIGFRNMQGLKTPHVKKNTQDSINSKCQ